MYRPNHAVRWFHDLPRYTKHLYKAPNEFPITVNIHDEDTDAYHWLEGCIFWAALFIAIGAIIFAVLSVLYPFLLCCCRPKQDSYQYHDPGTKKKRNYSGKIYIVVCILSVLYLVLAAATFGPVTTIAHAYNKGVDSIRETNSLLHDLTDSSSKIIAGARNASMTAEQIKNDINNASASVEQALTEIQTATNSTISAVHSATHATHKLTNALHDTANNLDRAGDKYITRGSYGYAAAMMVCVLVLVITLLPCRLFSISYKFLGVPLNLIFLVVLWSATGAFLLSSVSLSDFCVAPDDNAVALVADNRTATTVEAISLRYYMRCESSPQYAPEGVYKYLQTSVSQLNETSHAYIDHAVQELQLHGYNQAAMRVQALQVPVSSSLSSAQELTETLSCSSVRKPWNKAVNAVCTKFVGKGLTSLWAISTALCVILALILIFGLSLCRRHPGAKQPKNDNQNAFNDGYDPLAGNPKPGVVEFGAGPTYV